jgi:hypothetical protein
MTCLTLITGSLAIQPGLLVPILAHPALAGYLDLPIMPQINAWVNIPLAAVIVKVAHTTTCMDFPWRG